MGSDSHKQLALAPWAADCPREPSSFSRWVYTPGSRLAINDNSGADGRVFFAPAPEVDEATDGMVDVSLQADPGSLTLVGEETGVEVVLNYGASIGRAIRVALVQRPGERKVAVRTASGFSNGISADWSLPTDVRIEKLSNFSVRITVAGITEQIGASSLAQSTRSTPSFDFGCFSGPATAHATFGAIGLPQGPVLVATVQPPINPDGSSSFNATRGVVPLKFSLASDGSPTCDLPPATLSLSRTGGTSAGPIDESVYTGPCDSGSESGSQTASTTTTSRRASSVRARTWRRS